MKITEMPFNSILRTDEPVTRLDTFVNRYWTGPFRLPTPIRFFGESCTHFALSSWGALRFAGASGKWFSTMDDGKLVEGVDKTKRGWLLAPWGQLQRLHTCGTNVSMYQVGSVVVINYDVKNDPIVAIRYQYQVQFDLRQPNIASVHYYSCSSGYITFVGMVASPDKFASWGLKENTAYMSKALRFDTRLEAPEEIPVVLGDEEATPPGQFPTAIPERPVVPSPHHPPFVGFPDPLPTGTPLSKEWIALDDKYEYRIQRRAK